VLAGRGVEGRLPGAGAGSSQLDRGVRYDQHVRGLARAAGLPFRHRLIRLAGVGHTAADVLAAERTREIVFAGGRGQPRA
jgi:hypothetical protein